MDNRKSREFGIYRYFDRLNCTFLVGAVRVTWYALFKLQSNLVNSANPVILYTTLLER